MSKKHHMTKREYNSQKKYHRQTKRRRDAENEAVQEQRVSHGRLREKNQLQHTQQIRSLNDIEDDFMDFTAEDDEISA